MTSISRTARIAGAIYLLLGVTGPLRLIYIPTTLFVRGDATATANNIAANELLFRFGMVGDLLAGTIVIFLVLVLYQLFEGVDKRLAALMVILGGVLPAALYFANVTTDAAALLFVRAPDFLSVFEKAEREALAMVFLRMHEHGVLANEIFWGLWLLPFGLLINKSGFLPRMLGIWLIVNGVAYLALALTGFLLPGYESTLAAVLFPALFGEVAVMLWLLVKGAKVPAAAAF